MRHISMIAPIPIPRPIAPSTLTSIGVDRESSGTLCRGLNLSNRQITALGTIAIVGLLA